MIQKLMSRMERMVRSSKIDLKMDTCYGILVKTTKREDETNQEVSKDNDKTDRYKMGTSFTFELEGYICKTNCILMVRIQKI